MFFKDRNRQASDADQQNVVSALLAYPDAAKLMGSGHLLLADGLVDAEAISNLTRKEARDIVDGILQVW